MVFSMGVVIGKAVWPVFRHLHAMPYELTSVFMGMECFTTRFPSIVMFGMHPDELITVTNARYVGNIHSIYNIYNKYGQYLKTYVYYKSYCV